MRKAVVTVLACLTALSLPMSGAAAEDEPPIKAFSAWNARGQIFETGENRMTFVGSFAGIVYVDNAQGPIDAGYMICPTVLDVNTVDGKEQAKGRCTVTAKDGARLYADFDCHGVRMVGCDGDFTFTGGTERFKGVTGGGPVTIRSSVDDMAAGGGNIIEGVAAGIIVWPKLTYKLAAQ
jgi:hypothetical protein